jgi:hypothetical protein
MASARHGLAVALVDYVTALETRSLPVPHTLRRELQLHRGLFDRSSYLPEPPPWGTTGW